MAAEETRGRVSGVSPVLPCPVLTSLRARGWPSCGELLSEPRGRGQRRGPGGGEAPQEVLLGSGEGCVALITLLGEATAGRGEGLRSRDPFPGSPGYPPGSIPGSGQRGGCLSGPAGRTWQPAGGGVRAPARFLPLPGKRPAGDPYPGRARTGFSTGSANGDRAGRSQEVRRAAGSGGPCPGPWDPHSRERSPAQPCSVSWGLHSLCPG